jgi:hypothetical protein
MSILQVMALSCTPGDLVRRECPNVLDEDTLSRLQLSLIAGIEMQPGETRNMTVGTGVCCVYFEPVDACVTWSVEPGEAATISESGELTIGSSTAHGTVLTVTADVENGRRLISDEVYVYDLAQNPLVGNWHEAAQFTCGDQQEVMPNQPIQELKFHADGKVDVTWMPFEVYIDYWGTYKVSGDGSIELTITSGAYVPDDLDGTGRYAIDEDGQLILQDMWLGSPQGGGDVAHCGHRFVR